MRWLLLSMLITICAQSFMIHMQLAENRKMSALADRCADNTDRMIDAFKSLHRSHGKTRDLLDDCMLRLEISYDSSAWPRRSQEPAP